MNFDDRLAQILAPLGPGEEDGSDQVTAATLTLVIEFDPSPGPNPEAQSGPDPVSAPETDPVETMRARGVSMEITERVLGKKIESMEEAEFLLAELMSAIILRLEGWQ